MQGVTQSGFQRIMDEVNSRSREHREGEMGTKAKRAPKFKEPKGKASVSKSAVIKAVRKVLAARAAGKK